MILVHDKLTTPILMCIHKQEMSSVKETIKSLVTVHVMTNSKQLNKQATSDSCFLTQSIVTMATPS